MKRQVKTEVSATPKCAAIAEKGITNSREFAQYMSSLIGDITTGRVDPRVAASACNAGGKLLKVIEMEHKYGKKGSAGIPLV